MSEQERCFELVKRLAGFGMFSTGKLEHGKHVIVIPHWSFDRLEEFMDRDRFSDEYDPEPDYDRPTRAEAAAELRDDYYPPKTKEHETVSDPTETARRAMLATGQPAADLAAELGIDGPTWNTEELSRDFSVVGFMAPFVVVKRKSDGKKGTLEFTHSPRVYFGWRED